MQFFPLCTFVSFVVDEAQSGNHEATPGTYLPKLRFYQNHGRVIVQSGAVGK